MMPRSRSEATSSSSSALGKARRGLRGLGRKAAVGKRLWLRDGRSTEVSAAMSPIKAASPRPNRDRAWSSASFPGLTLINASLRAQFFLALDHLGREPQISFAAAAFKIVDQHRLAVRRRFRDTHVARNDGVVNFGAHEFTDVRDHLGR